MDDGAGTFTVLLLILSVVEFVIALSAAIVTCQFACRDESSCCADSQKGNESDIEKNSMTCC